MPAYVALYPLWGKKMRHVMVAEDHAAPGAASDRYAPCYGDKIGRCILSEEHQIDELS